jgi:hypothetical protein
MRHLTIRLLVAVALCHLARPAAAQQTRPATPAAAESASKSPADRAPLPAELKAAIEQLIDRLGADEYERRVDAQKSLVDLYRACLDLLTARLADKDEEVRHRLQEVIEAIAADAAFCQALAQLPPERHATMVAFRQRFPEVCRKAFASKSAERVAAVLGIEKLDDTKGLAEPLLLMHLTGPSEELMAAAARAARCGRYKSDAMVDALCNVLIRRFQYYAIDQGYGDGWTPQYWALTAIRRIGARRAAPTLVALLVQPGLDCSPDGVSLVSALAAANERRAIPHLLPLLEKTDPDVLMGPDPDKRTATVAMSDLALGALLRLTGQDLDSYGFAAKRPPVLEGRGFKSKQDRAKAIAKFRKWWDAHKGKAPYKDLKPLDLPSIPSRWPDWKPPLPFEVPPLDEPPFPARGPLVLPEHIPDVQPWLEDP